jgi:hypothetical protein
MYNSANRANRYMAEAEEEADQVKATVLKIFYNDLTLKGKQKVLQAIDDANEMADVFGDDVIRANVEEELLEKPIVTITGEDLSNKMDIDF